MESAARHVALWRDWCAATGADPALPDPDSLSRFDRDCPVSTQWAACRSAAICRAVGFPALVPERPVNLQEMGDRLEQAPAWGWPEGLVGRRDSAVVALVVGAGMGRHALHGLRAGGLLELIGRLEQAGPARRCGRCALARWAQALAVGHEQGRRVLRWWLSEPPGPDAENPHACDPAEAGLLATNELARIADRPAFVALDRLGNPGLDPLSTRSISAIVSRSAASRGAGAEGLAPSVPEGWGPVRRSAADSFARLDRLFDELEVGLERMQNG